jgi:hypothetical protein
MQKTVKSNPIARVIGIVPMVAGAAMIYTIHSAFADDFFADFRPFMYAISGFMTLAGVFLLCSTTEIIYDEETVEKTTRLFGFKWSHKVDRSLVRDIGPEAAGLIPRRSPHGRHRSDLFDRD